MNLILINFIITYVWDILNFPNKILGIITGWLTNGKINNTILKPPFGCSFCMIFWVSLIYLLICKYAVLIAITIALLNAIISKVVLYTILLIDSIIEKIFRLLDSVVNK